VIRSVDQMQIEGLRVLLRVDFNCPLEGGKVADDTRIRAALPTIRHALKERARVVVMSHLGRPGGEPDPSFSLEPVGLRLAELLDADVILADDCVGDGARKVVADLYGGRIAMLENLRFNPGEKGKDEKFAAELASFGDVYVNDAFGVCHRGDASVALVPRLIEQRCAGLNTMRELEALGRLLGEVKRPYAAILGGAKISDKIKVIQAQLERIDALLVGGAMANTFLAAQGHSMGGSLVEEGSFVHARAIIEEARRHSVRVLLPVDLVVSSGPEDSSGTVVPVDGVPDGKMALDVGPGTLEAFSAEIGKAGTIFWNGPMGLFERPPFDAGTVGVAEAVGRSLAFSVVGGGDSVAAIRQSKLESRFDHISTGGGASLALVGGQEMPGLRALEDEP
jgi:phosphoglycerate kinase